MMEQEDIVISYFLKAIGPWNEHIVVSGGYALIIYRLYLTNQHAGIYPVGTRDIDSLISRKVPKIEISLAESLEKAAFVQTFKDVNNPATECYVKNIDGEIWEVEFLTDRSTRGDKLSNLHIHDADVTAQQLNYIELPLKHKKSFKTFSGESGYVASPSAWIFQKGLTFTKRKDKVKTYKDLYGIWYVTTQLGDLSELAIHEFSSLAQDNSSWFKTFKKHISKWLESSFPIDWARLEGQDPSGNLNKNAFTDAMMKLFEV